MLLIKLMLMLAGGLFIPLTHAESAWDQPGPTATQPAARNAGLAPHTIALARQYMASRPALFGPRDVTGCEAMQKIDNATLHTIVKALRAGDGNVTEWAEQDARWQRMAAIIDNDRRSMCAALKTDAHFTRFLQGINEVFVYGIAARLSDGQLLDLIAYYSSRPGAEFSALQQKMFEESLAGMATLQQRPGDQSLPALSEAEASSLLLFKKLIIEQIAIQAAMMDPGPGPGHDRSVAPSIPLMFEIGAQAHLGKIAALWDAEPAQARAAIVAWRATPLAATEFHAIHAAANEIRSVVDVQEEMKRMGSAQAPYEKKWRADVQGD